MSHPDTTSKDAVFQWRGIPQPGQLLPLGLQHVVAAVVGVITPAILVADTCGLSSADKTLMIQVSLILIALATLLQLFPIFHRIGSGLPSSWASASPTSPRSRPSGWRIRPAHHTGRGDRGRHRCIRLRGAGQVDPPPVPSPGHRHGDLHHRPVPLSHRCKVHGRRCRLRVVRQRQELGGGPYHPGCGGLPQPLHQGHHQAGLHPHWHTGRLCHCLFPGHRGSVRGGQRGLGRPAQAHAL